MKQKAFGLDIGTTSLKAIWLSQERNGYTLNAVGSLPIQQNSLLSESPFDQEQIGRSIRKMVTDAKISTPHVNIALPENQVYTKVIEMPVLSEKELSQAIYWEAEQYIPVPLQNVAFDYRVLKHPNAAEEATMEVLLVGAPLRLIEKYQKIASLAGLNILSLETEILSTMRALILGENFPTSLIITMQNVSTSLAIVRNGVLVFTYFVPVGGVTLSRAIAEDFGLSSAQAEEYKKTYGVYGGTVGGKIGKATEPLLMSIVTEVRKAIAFYTEKYKSAEAIRQIILSGESAKLPGIDLFFAQNCGLETVTANPWKVLIDQKQLPTQLLENAPDYTVSMGLAMR